MKQWLWCNDILDSWGIGAWFYALTVPVFGGIFTFLVFNAVSWDYGKGMAIISVFFIVFSLIMVISGIAFIIQARHCAQRICYNNGKYEIYNFLSIKNLCFSPNEICSIHKFRITNKHLILSPPKLLSKEVDNFKVNLGNRYFYLNGSAEGTHDLIDKFRI